MIIENNFNERDANPKKDYRIIGNKRNSLDNAFLKEKDNEYVDNNTFSNVEDEDEVEDNLDREDRWSFFK